MPIPHDYYAPWSDEPHLHNRGEGRPYVEPSWQANAAGYQLPILSTIGRGPRGVGLSVANAQVNDAYFSFDLVSDETGEVVQHVGPIPTGEVEVNVLGDQVSFITNQVELDSQGDPVIRKVTKTVTLPSGEAGTRIFMVDDGGAVRYKAQDDIYHIPMSQISYYNSQNTHREDETPEMRAGDMVMFVVYSDETDRLPEMAYGFFTSIANEDYAVVKAIEYLPTIKGKNGHDGHDGQGSVHAWEASAPLEKSYSNGRWYVNRKEIWPKVCHVDDPACFVGLGHKVGWQAEWGYSDAEMGGRYEWMKLQNLVSFRTAMSEWYGPSYVWQEDAIDGGFFIYFCPRAQDGMIVYSSSEESDVDEFLQNYDSYSMSGAYMIVDPEDIEHPQTFDPFPPS